MNETLIKMLSFNISFSGIMIELIINYPCDYYIKKFEKYKLEFMSLEQNVY